MLMSKMRTFACFLLAVSFGLSGCDQRPVGSAKYNLQIQEQFGAYAKKHPADWEASLCYGAMNTNFDVARSMWENAVKYEKGPVSALYLGALYGGVFEKSNAKFSNERSLGYLKMSLKSDPSNAVTKFLISAATNNKLKSPDLLNTEINYYLPEMSASCVHSIKRASLFSNHNLIVFASLLPDDLRHYIQRFFEKSNLLPDDTEAIHSLYSIISFSVKKGMEGKSLPNYHYTQPLHFYILAKNLHDRFSEKGDEEKSQLVNLAMLSKKNMGMLRTQIGLAEQVLKNPSKTQNLANGYWDYAQAIQ
jgi:hypothetical protein